MYFRFLGLGAGGGLRQGGAVELVMWWYVIVSMFLVTSRVQFDLYTWIMHSEFNPNRVWTKYSQTFIRDHSRDQKNVASVS